MVLLVVHGLLESVDTSSADRCWINL